MGKIGTVVLIVGATVLGLLMAGEVRAEAASIRQGSATIDELVSAKLSENHIAPSKICPDAVFLRRVYLDMTGTIPTIAEAKRFIESTDPNKRVQLIETLFGSNAFADYWSMKWCDLLRVKAEFPSNLWPNAVQVYQRWLWDAMRDNMPYNEFARALLVSSGSNFRVAPVNFYRALAKRDPTEMAAAAALVFMGVRTEHLSKEQLLGMSAFFGKVNYKSTAEWKEEIVFFDPLKEYNDPETKQPIQPALPDGGKVALSDDQDPRAAFADWLTAPDNKWFASNCANRIWYWLLGRGIVQEPDDFSPDNPPSNPELLDFLARELITSGYDTRHLFRIILNSETYQRSSHPAAGNASDQTLFSHYYVRRLDAEVLIDAICQVTGTHEQYSSAIPEPFTWIPEKQRSIALADGSITSPFLDLFGRPPRDTGYLEERNNTPSSAQALHLLNSSHILDKLNQSPLLVVQQVAKQRPLANKSKFQKAAGKPAPVATGPEKVVDKLYLGILSRHPTDNELQTALDYVKGAKTPREGETDVAWALLNSTEFSFKH